MSVTRVPQFIGQPAWFGKLPSESEFFSRRMLPDFGSAIEEWMRDGMKHLAVTEPEEWRERYLVAPLWHFAMTPDIWSREAVVGCLAPSADRFGRAFPLIVLQGFRGEALGALLPPQCDWLPELDQLARDCVGQSMASEEFDRRVIELTRAADIKGLDSTSGILKDLGIAESGKGRPQTHFPWPDLREQFPLRRCRSFWWAETAPSRPARQIVHSGMPDSALFRLMFGEI
jgi:type VI secretion system protein ImpM